MKSIEKSIKIDDNTTLFWYNLVGKTKIKRSELSSMNNYSKIISNMEEKIKKFSEKMLLDNGFDAIMALFPLVSVIFIYFS